MGTIKEGLYGALVAVKGDPLSDISVLEDDDIVIKGACSSKRLESAAHNGRH
ncbi:MAG TPA: hypothetical protein DCS89_02590 [Gammaproteobacteria bacterium]|nr:hypothetical protein [Gammaproteobacteria bacterium]